MIKGIHGLFYSSRPEETRAFLRDKLRLPFTDTGEGWLIFDLPEGDLGVHPTDTGSYGPGTHAISFYTDDIRTTCSELADRGVEFEHVVQDHGWGFVTQFTMPGGVRVQLYQPKYKKRAKTPTAAKPAKAAKKAPVKKKVPAKTKAAKKRK